MRNKINLVAKNSESTKQIFSLITTFCNISFVATDSSVCYGKTWATKHILPSLNLLGDKNTFVAKHSVGQENILLPYISNKVSFVAIEFVANTLFSCGDFILHESVHNDFVYEILPLLLAYVKFSSRMNLKLN